MRAIRLCLTDFRNYDRQTIDFSDGVNIIYGDNAQGKTNILEAVYFFAMGKSNRARRDSELIRHGTEKAEIELVFEDSVKQNTLKGEIFKGKRKKISINEITIRRNSELVRRFNVVYFGPEYLSLVKDGPAMRRKSIDILISQVKTGYMASLGELKRIVDSKNALLRMEYPNLTMLDIMDEKLAKTAADIILCRSVYIRRLEKMAKSIQKDISKGAEELDIKYNCCAGDISGLDLNGIYLSLKDKLSENRPRELKLREAVIGPHREDMVFYINNQEAKVYASQGQQKTIVMALKLAEVELINSETGEQAVLLLDDIMSELDRSRREYILSHIKDMQILITCTDTDGMEVPDTASKIRVSKGKAYQENADGFKDVSEDDLEVISEDIPKNSSEDDLEDRLEDRLEDLDNNL